MNDTITDAKTQPRHQPPLVLGTGHWPVRDCSTWRLLQWRKRIDDVHDEDVGGKDDDVHRQGKTDRGWLYQHVHRRAGLIGIEAVDDQVRRRADKSADAAHARGVAQRDEQFRRRDAQLLRPQQ